MNTVDMIATGIAGITEAMGTCGAEIGIQIVKSAEEGVFQVLDVGVQVAQAIIGG